MGEARCHLLWVDRENAEVVELVLAKRQIANLSASDDQEQRAERHLAGTHRAA